VARQKSSDDLLGLKEELYTDVLRTTAYLPVLGAARITEAMVRSKGCHTVAFIAATASIEEVRFMEIDVRDLTIPWVMESAYGYS
jgi:hypothetical protein